VQSKFNLAFWFVRYNIFLLVAIVGPAPGSTRSLSGACRSLARACSPVVAVSGGAISVHNGLAWASCILPNLACEHPVRDDGGGFTVPAAAAPVRYTLSFYRFILQCPVRIAILKFVLCHSRNTRTPLI
jgi:hypothetical protein